MTRHWRLAAGGTLATVVFALPAAVAVAFYSGGSDALSFGYGVCVGLVAFVSIAISAALMISGEPSETKLALGFGVYLARLVFAAMALGLPAIAGSWPIAPMVGGFVGVYVVENIALLVGAWRMSAEMRLQTAERVQEVGEVREMERRVS